MTIMLTIANPLRNLSRSYRVLYILPGRLPLIHLASSYILEVRGCLPCLKSDAELTLKIQTNFAARIKLVMDHNQDSGAPCDYELTHTKNKE